MIIDLVFSGGGVKAIAFIGVVEALEERGIKVRRIAGTSAGALVGALLSAGYKSEELKKMLPILSQLFFNEVSDVEIKDSSPTYSSSPFIYLEGSDTRNVILQNNNFYKINRVVEFDESFKKSELIEFNNLKK